MIPEEIKGKFEQHVRMLIQTILPSLSNLCSLGLLRRNFSHLLHCLLFGSQLPNLLGICSVTLCIRLAYYACKVHSEYWYLIMLYHIDSAKFRGIGSQMVEEF